MGVLHPSSEQSLQLDRLHHVGWNPELGSPKATKVVLSVDELLLVSVELGTPSETYPVTVEASAPCHTTLA
jgi:hypothetical protein